MIESLLLKGKIKASELDGVAFGCGPGSFTGVRIAAAVAQGIAFGANIGVIPVSSLQALAQSANRQHKATHVLASFDARMGEVYWGVYVSDDNGFVMPVQNDTVCAPEHITLPADADQHEWCLLGSGADEYVVALKERIGLNMSVNHVVDSWPAAEDILQIAIPLSNSGSFSKPADAVPVYLRDKVALTTKERASGERL